MFLSQLPTRISYLLAIDEMARVWYGSRLGTLGLWCFREWRTVRRKVSNLDMMSFGMSQSLCCQMEGKCILGINSSLLTCGRPEKYTLVYRSLRNRLKVLICLLLMVVVTGQNLRPRPMTDGRHLGRSVVGRVRSCRAR